jgi:membrane protein implicated in regulation of membrane protease activity
MHHKKQMSRFQASLWIGGSLLLSAAGLAAFIILFIPDFNVYWLIVSPLVIAVYQIPAVVLFYFYRKRRKNELEEKNSEEKEAS